MQDVAITHPLPPALQPHPSPHQHNYPLSTLVSEPAGPVSHPNSWQVNLPQQTPPTCQNISDVPVREELVRACPMQYLHSGPWISPYMPYAVPSYWSVN